MKLKDLRQMLIGEAAREDLPARVQIAIEAQQRNSEIMIAVCQLLIGLLWASLYSLAPRSFPDNSDFAPVPIALGFYLLFAVLRLWIVAKKDPGPLFLGFSVVVDISVLLVLIWSFHLQYMQPAAFYLKAPTMVYLFIFIALRSLRYSVGYVLTAGLTAAVGWLTLLGYALYTARAADMGITRDYVAYMTSNSILVGAELDKIIAILLVTGILALSIRRARNLLITAVSESTAHRDLTRFFSPEVSAAITRAEKQIHPGEGVLRQAAILFCDIRGFTGRARNSDPDEIMQLLGDYQRRMIAVIEAHGGIIDKFLGDGILATFGAVQENPRAAADALRAVTELGAAADALNEELIASGRSPVEIGFAVEYGRVIFGAVGDSRRLEFTVIGDAVNRAAKMEDANKICASRAITSPACLAAALEQGYEAPETARVLENHRVPGLAEPLDLVVLLDQDR